MGLETHGWYNDLKYGGLVKRVRYVITSCQLMVRILALELMVIGGLALSLTYMLKTRAGYTLHKMLATVSDGAAWAEAKSLKSLNIGDSLNLVIESTYNSFGLVTVSGIICFILSFWRSKRGHYVCLFVLMMSLVIQSRELKNFDNVLAPIQNTTMLKLRTTIIDRQNSLPKDFLATMDILMHKGHCCGVIAGSDMSLLSDETKRKIVKQWHQRRGSSKTPQSSCWLKDYDASRDMGCYVYYFENFMKPYGRCLHGLSMISQIIMVNLIASYTDIPITMAEVLRLIYFDRMATPFSID